MDLIWLIFCVIIRNSPAKVIIKAIQQNIQESRKEWLLEQFNTEEGFRFWRSDNKPIELWSNSVIDQKIDYIH